MKAFIVLILSVVSISAVGQTDYKKQLDSLTTVHKVCVIENSIRNHRIKMDHLKKKRQSLQSQLSEIQSFKLGRSDSEKEEQLEEIKHQIEANAVAYTEATVELTTMINDLVLANEDVKDLKNQ